jgi:hypothetical protein
VDVFVGVKDSTGFGTYSWEPGLISSINRQLPSTSASGVVLYVCARLSRVSPWLTVITIQPAGYWHWKVVLVLVADGGNGVGVGVRVGSPGRGVSTMTVGEMVNVSVGVGDESWAISLAFSENEMTRLPAIIKRDMRAARSPVITSRRMFMGYYPLKTVPRRVLYARLKGESIS